MARSRATSRTMYDYPLYGTAAPKRRTDSERVRVVPGDRPQRREQDRDAVSLVKIALAILLAFALLGCVRVALTSATVTTTLQNERIAAQIDNSRTEGNALEVQYSAMASSKALQKAATKLGMTEAWYVENLALPKDVVATDEAGNLSLSKSLAAAAGE